MWPFSKPAEPEKKNGKKRRMIRRVIVGFIIGSAISSIVGKALLHEKRREHVGEDNEQ